MDEHAPVSLTLHRIQPTEELLCYVYRSCDALSRRIGRPTLWRVAVEHGLSGRGQYVVRVRPDTSLGLGPVRSEAADPFRCVREAFNVLAEQLRPPGERARSAATRPQRCPQHRSPGSTR